MTLALNDTAAGLLTIAVLVGLLALVYVPLGDYMATVLTPTKHTRFERGTYRVLGVNPDGQQSARSYILAVIGFSVVSLVVLFLILVGQSSLPFSRGLPGMPWEMALNTSISFVTSYHRETNYLRVYLAQLRRKLDEEPGRPRHFITEPGVGYRFIP
jgi:K+-transporting ATPase ATPase A chain